MHNLKLTKKLGILFFSAILLFNYSCKEEKSENNKNSETKTFSNSIKKLKVQFGWIPDVHHSGFYLASKNGYYKEENIDIDFIPGGLDSNPVSLTVSGSVDIGQAGGLEQFIPAVSNNLPITAFMTLHPLNTPHAIISLSRKPIKKPNDLKGKKVAVAYGDAAEILLNTLIKKNNIDKASINFEPFRFDLRPLIDGRVDAITGFSTDQPATLEAQNLKPVIMDYASMGVKSYGYIFFCKNQMLQEHPEYIEGFIKASRKGFQYAFDHPKEAIDIMVTGSKGGLKEDIEQRKLNLVKKLMVNSSNKLASWNIEADVFNEVTKNLIDQKQIKTKIPLEKVVSTKFKDINAKNY